MSPDRLWPKFSEIAQAAEEVKQRADIPDPSDVQGTLEYWDAYRRKERERIYGLGLKYDDEAGLGTVVSGSDFRSHFEIGEFPTEENLRKLEEKRALERAKMLLLERRCEFNLWPLWKQAVFMFGWYNPGYTYSYLFPKRVR